MYGASYTGQKDNRQIDILLQPVPQLEKLIRIRKEKALGKQIDYFENNSIVGWVRQGIVELQDTVCAVVLSNAFDGQKEMEVGVLHADVSFYDITGNVSGDVKIGKNEFGIFLVYACIMFVWVRR